MNPIQLNFSLTIAGESAEAFVDLLVRAILRGTSRCVQELPKPPPMTEAVQRPVYVPTPPPPEGKDDAMLIDTHRVSNLLGVSPRKLWQMYNSGEMPAPIRIGRAVRWSHEELRAWVDAGCPPQDVWKRSGRK